MMKKLLLLLVVSALVATCDRSPSEPDIRHTFQATVRAVPDGESAMIGALLLSLDASVAEVASSSARVLTHPDGDELVAVLTVGSPVSTVSFRLEVVGGATPTIRILQVADASNQLYADPAAFLVELEED